MISERAKTSLNAMVMQGMRSSLIGPSDTALSLEPVAPTLSRSLRLRWSCCPWRRTSSG